MPVGTPVGGVDTERGGRGHHGEAVATIRNRWHRPLSGRDADAGRPDSSVEPSGGRGSTPGRGGIGVTRTWVVLMVGLLAFAAASAVVILAR